MKRSARPFATVARARRVKYVMLAASMIAGCADELTPPDSPRLTPAQPLASIAASSDGLTSFESAAAFVRASGATQRVRFPEITSGVTFYLEGAVTIRQPANFGLYIEHLTPLVAGNTLAISGSEHLDISLAAPARAFGIWLQDGVAVGCVARAGHFPNCDQTPTGIDSRWTITFKRNGAVVGTLEVDPPVDELSFVGVIAAQPFDRIEFREVGGTMEFDPFHPSTENDFFGAIFLAETIVPANRAPEASAGGPYAAEEGSPVAFSGAASDPDGDALAYAWDFGDGSSPVAGGTLTTSHRYADDGEYVVTLTARDPIGLEAVSHATVIVSNVAPTVSAGIDAKLVSGNELLLSGSFSDPGAVDGPWAYTIDWGDGAVTTGGAAAPGAIGESHRYTRAGSYIVKLSVRDQDDGVGSDALELTVERLEVAIDVPSKRHERQPDGKKIPLKGKQTLWAAILSSPSFDATRVDAATVTLGDGVGADTPVQRDRDGSPIAMAADVDGDGRADLVLAFDKQAMVAAGDLTASTTRLVLLGDVLAPDGRQIRGSDAVIVK